MFGRERTESDELMGSNSFVSRFPQYLITAILTGAVHVIWSTASASRRTRLASDWNEQREKGGGGGGSGGAGVGADKHITEVSRSYE